MSNKERFIELMDKFISGKLSAGENQVLMEMLDQNENDPELDHILRDSYQQSGDSQFWTEDYRRVFTERLLAKANLNASGDVNLRRPVHRVHFLRRWGWAAAAIIILGAGITTAVIVSSDQQASSETPSPNYSQTDVLPGGERAILTLADGTTILLDSAANGNLANQGGTQVVKLADGQLAYDLTGSARGELMMNTMTTPNGGQYQLTLPDGSKVWLNAASSIQFPAAFVGDKREVKITGEVYFEVMKNKEKPFIVDIDGKSEVEVLGTSFNINSYADEGNIKTTLLEGSVQINYANKSATLKPGQQATTAVAAMAEGQPSSSPMKGGEILIQPADISQALAWKNGLFNFNGLGLRIVMRQIERWYDIKVKYEGNVPDLIFRGEMYRTANLSEALDIFQKLGVKFKLEGRTLTVM